MQRASAVTLKVFATVTVGGMNGAMFAHSPREMLLYARTVQPLPALMNASDTPFDPSPHSALMKVLQLTATVPVGHAAVLTVV